MKRISNIGRAVFALSVAGLAMLSLIYGSFAPLVEPFPASLPVPALWAYGPGLVVLAASAGLFFARTAFAGAAAIAAFNLLWVMTRVRPVLHDPLGVGSWYGVCEASGPLLAGWMLIAGGRGRPCPAGARVLFGACCLAYGAAHFAYAAYTASMVPTWLPGPKVLAYVTGALHAAAGLGLIVGVFPRLAAALEALMIGLFGFLVWLPSFFARPAPLWAPSAQVRVSETLLTFLLAGSAAILAASLKDGRPESGRRGAGQPRN